MNKEELNKLKEFIEEWFDFKTLKSIGFFAKDVKKTDYERIADRICKFFGYASIYEYALNVPKTTHHTETTSSGHKSMSVDGAGEIKSGGSFHVDLSAHEFACPICTKEQSIEDYPHFIKSSNPSMNVKCRGCKRKINLFSAFRTLIVTEVI